MKFMKRVFFEEKMTSKVTFSIEDCLKNIGCNYAIYENECAFFFKGLGYYMSLGIVDIGSNIRSVHRDF